MAQQDEKEVYPTEALEGKQNSCRIVTKIEYEHWVRLHTNGKEQPKITSMSNT